MSEIAETTRGNLRESAMYLPTELDGSTSEAGFSKVPTRRLIEADFRAALAPNAEVARLQAALDNSRALARRLALASVEQRQQIASLTKQLEALQSGVRGGPLDPKGYYRALGIYPEDLIGLSEEQIQKMVKNGYKTAASIHHPDQGGDKRRAQLINQARQVLSDVEKRQRYGQ